MDDRDLANLKIGDRVFVLDLNRRVYDSKRSGSPIWREYWRPMFVIGETRRNWVLGWLSDVGCDPKAFPRTAQRIPLAGPPPENILLSEDDLDAAAYVEDMRSRLRDVVQQVPLRPEHEPTLRKIEAVLREAGIDIPERL